MATPVTETVRATTGRARMPADHKTGLWVGLPEDHVGERGTVGVARRRKMWLEASVVGGNAGDGDRRADDWAGKDARGPQDWTVGKDARGPQDWTAGGVTRGPCG